jgi:hypothetical protein
MRENCIEHALPIKDDLRIPHDFIQLHGEGRNTLRILAPTLAFAFALGSCDRVPSRSTEQRPTATQESASPERKLALLTSSFPDIATYGTPRAKGAFEHSTASTYWFDYSSLHFNPNAALAATNAMQALVKDGVNFKTTIDGSSQDYTILPVSEPLVRVIFVIPENQKYPSNIPNLRTDMPGFTATVQSGENITFVQVTDKPELAGRNQVVILTELLHSSVKIKDFSGKTATDYIRHKDTVNYSRLKDAQDIIDNNIALALFFMNAGYSYDQYVTVSKSILDKYYTPLPKEDYIKIQAIPPIFNN